MLAGPTVALIVVLLVTSLATCTLLITTTDAPTKWLPVTFSTNVALTSASVTLVGLMDVRTGAGRELLQSGLIAEQPGSASMVSSRAVSGQTAERDGIKQLLGVRIERFRPVRSLVPAEKVAERVASASHFLEQA
jgi:hypothetical protein